ncbi:MAG: DNA N-6-adenine-methyltransferase [Bacteroidota bacterium]
MIVNKQLANSVGCEQKDKWETPAHIFEPLMKEFKFTLDPCAEKHTAKCSLFYTESEDGLTKPWHGQTVFVNPPYSRGNIDKWVKKCYEESRHGNTIVALIPVSTSSKWFHEYVWRHATIRFYQGRIRFVGAPFTAPFSSMLAIYNVN